MSSQDFNTLYSIPQNSNIFIDLVSPPVNSSLQETSKFSKMEAMDQQILMDRKIAFANSHNFSKPSPVISNPKELILVNPAKNLYYTREMIETEKANQIKSLERKAEILKSRVLTSPVISNKISETFAQPETFAEAPHMTSETF
jgi:hypothetical protein